jgi:hypothetical protein
MPTVIGDGSGARGVGAVLRGFLTLRLGCFGIDCIQPAQRGSLARSESVRQNRRLQNHQQSLLKPPVFVLPPATESTFRIAEFTSNFLGIIFSALETVFCITKIARYLIE